MKNYEEKVKYDNEGGTKERKHKFIFIYLHLFL